MQFDYFIKALSWELELHWLYSKIEGIIWLWLFSRQLFSWSKGWVNFFLFKTFVDGADFEFDLVQWMLQNAWMMFDHVKHVQRWMTMAYHVYDSIYYKVMMNAVNDMQYEDTETSYMCGKNSIQLLIRNGWVHLCSRGSWQILCK